MLLDLALRIDEAVYGSKHPEVATDAEALAPVLDALGEHARAQSLRERAQRIRATAT
jgi:hypothetical protein